MKKAKKPAARAKSEDYLPIPPAPAPDMSAVEKVMGHAFPPAQRYPITNDYEKTGSYAPYRNEAMDREEQMKIQDELLNEQVKHMTRDPSSERIAPGSPVDQLTQQYAGEPSFPAESRYGTDQAYPKRPMYESPKHYGQAPFEEIAPLPERNNVVPERSPYKVDQGVSTPFGTTPIEKRDMEEAIKRALQNAAKSGAGAGNAVKFRR